MSVKARRPQPRPAFFATPAAFGRWLAAHHDSTQELWVGFYKKASGRPSITWPESVDEALCWGWIDGLRKSVDDVSYMIRFTPRRRDSVWSQVNLRRVRALMAGRRMRAPGLAVFEARDPRKDQQHSFANRPSTLPPAYQRRLQADARAWAFFQRQPPGYQRSCAWWILSAKQESTRQRRLATLIAESARGRTPPPLTRKAPTAGS